MEMRVTDGEAGAVVSDAGREHMPLPFTGVREGAPQAERTEVKAQRQERAQH